MANPNKTIVKTPDGRIIEIDNSQLPAVLDPLSGYSLATPEQLHSYQNLKEYSGVGHSLLAMGSAALGTATLGLSDTILAEASPEIRKALQAYEEVQSPYRIAGTLAGAFIPNGVGALGGAIEKGVASLGGKSAAGQLTARVAGLGARGVGEGMIYGAGAATSEAAIQDQTLTTEKLTSAVLHGAGLGAGLSIGIGVPLHVLGKAGHGALRYLAKRKASLDDVSDAASAEARAKVQKVEAEATPPGVDAPPVDPIALADTEAATTLRRTRQTLSDADIIAEPPGPAPARPEKPPTGSFYKQWIEDWDGVLRPNEHLDDLIPAPRAIADAHIEGDAILALRKEYPDLSQRALRAKYHELEQLKLQGNAAIGHPEQKLGEEFVTGGKPQRSLSPEEFAAEQAKWAVGPIKPPEPIAAKAPEPAPKPARAPSAVDFLPEATSGGFGENFGAKRMAKGGRTPAQEAEHLRIQAKKAENAANREAGIRARHPNGRVEFFHIHEELKAANTPAKKGRARAKLNKAKADQIEFEPPDAQKAYEAELRKAAAAEQEAAAKAHETGNESAAIKHEGLGDVLEAEADAQALAAERAKNAFAQADENVGIAKELGGDVDAAVIARNRAKVRLEKELAELKAANYPEKELAKGFKAQRAENAKDSLAQRALNRAEERLAQAEANAARRKASAEFQAELQAARDNLKAAKAQRIAEIRADAAQKAYERAEERLADAEVKAARKREGADFEGDLRAARAKQLQDAADAKLDAQLKDEYASMQDRMASEANAKLGADFDARLSKAKPTSTGNRVNPWGLGFAGSLLAGPWGHAAGLIAGYGINMFGKTRAISRLAEGLDKGLDKHIGKVFDSARKGVVRGVASDIPRGTVEEYRHALTGSGTNPDAVRKRVNDALKDVAGAAPNIRDGAVATVLRTQDVLREYLPPPNSSRAVNAEFLRIVDIIKDPTSIYKKADEGKLTKKQVRAFKKAYPARYDELMARIVQETIDMQAQGLTLPRAKMSSLSILMDRPLNPTNSAAFVQSMSSVYGIMRGASGPAPNAGGNAPPKGKGNVHTPELDFSPHPETEIGAKK